MERLYSELKLLKMLKHDNIMKFCDSWVDYRSRKVNFITEMFTSGTLRQYRQKHKHVNQKAIKHWCRQILQGLVYLHGHKPPIIHRDLKCDNIFINGNSGEVKIGDLGLALMLNGASAAHSVLGTPEFMAPELYEEHYNELVDIYSFGMCVLELVTLEYPYSECNNAAQIFKRVTSGKMPEALNKIKDFEICRFIKKCLASASERCHATELLMDKFLQMDEDLKVVGFLQFDTMDCHDDLRDLYPSFEGREYHHAKKFSQDEFAGRMNVAETALTSENNSSDLQSKTLHQQMNRDFKMKVQRLENKKVHIEFQIMGSRGIARFIQFDFDLDADTSITVAQEMVSELDLVDQDPTNIAEMIDVELMTLLPDWNPGSSLEEEDISMLDSEKHDPQQGDVFAAEQLQIPILALKDTGNTQCFNGICIHGRFAEVEFLPSESEHSHHELRGQGGISDFSSEQFECSCSDLSCDAEALNGQTKIDSMLDEQEMNKETNVELGISSPRRASCSMHGLNIDKNFNSEELRSLKLLQKQEVATLLSRHDQELLNLKRQLSKEPPISMKDFVIQEHTSSSTLDEVNHVEVVNGLKFHTVQDSPLRSETVDDLILGTNIMEDIFSIPRHLETQTSSHKGSISVNQSVNEKFRICNGRKAGELSLFMSAEAQSDPNREAMVNQDGEVPDLLGQSPETVNTWNSDCHPSSGEAMISEHAQVPNLLRASSETVDTWNLGIHTSKQEQTKAHKHQTYVGYFKNESNKTDVPLMKQHAISNRIPMHSCLMKDETDQGKKLRLQKIIADFETKTMECLSQSNSYVAERVHKNVLGNSMRGSQPASSGKNGM
ncbi:hypothetical protein KP509_27G035800 [Ceratopteris richardii]|nr:hypothetical protein KP509_27G035800 [Ceratopteris richardii]KAH7295171.1 hypothetical protein KP509_27G035800 [Ceratopteris richardii]KAH7295172.1 hypothetical protein KP509_27G035800 [Ceratopteris richardii]